MRIKLTRRAFARLAAFLAADGLKINEFSIAQEMQDAGEDFADPTSAQAGTSTDLAATTTKVLDSISDFATQATAALSASTKQIAEGSFTGSLYVFGAAQAGTIAREYDYGSAFSYRPSTTDYGSEWFETHNESATSESLPGAQLGFGLSIGIGELSGFNGKSTVTSINTGIVSIAVTTNDSYKGVSINVGMVGGGLGITYTDESQTSPTEGPDEGNAGEDLERFQKALQNWGTDPMML